MINLLVFDLDGTLFDTAGGIAKAFNNTLNEKGHPSVPENVISSYIGTGLRDLLVKLESHYDMKFTDSLAQLEADFRRHYDQNILQDSPLYPGVIEFLDSWPHQIAIVSNKTERYVHQLVAHTELKKYSWLRLIGGNTFVHKKPHPLPLQEVMRLAAAQPHNTLMIGDGLPDMQVANNTGVKSVAVSFGYAPLSELIQNGAHAYIDSYQELPKVIKSITSAIVD